MALEDIVPKPRVTLGEVFIKYLEKEYTYEFHILSPFHWNNFNTYYTSEEIEWMNWWIDTKCPK